MASRAARFSFGFRFFRLRLCFRFGVGFLHAFGNNVILVVVSYLAMQFHFITVQLALVFDAQYGVVAWKFDWLDKGYVILVSLKLDEFTLVRSQFAFANHLPGELSVLKLELERRFLLADC